MQLQAGNQIIITENGDVADIRGNQKTRYQLTIGQIINVLWADEICIQFKLKGTELIIRRVDIEFELIDE